MIYLSISGIEDSTCTGPLSKPGQKRWFDGVAPDHGEQAIVVAWYVSHEDQYAHQRRHEWQERYFHEIS